MTLSVHRQFRRCLLRKWNCWRWRGLWLWCWCEIYESTFSASFYFLFLRLSCLRFRVALHTIAVTLKLANLEIRLNAQQVKFTDEISFIRWKTKTYLRNLLWFEHLFDFTYRFKKSVQVNCNIVLFGMRMSEKRKRHVIMLNFAME